MDSMRNHLRASAWTGCLIALGATIAVTLAAAPSSNDLRVAQFLDGFILGQNNDLRSADNPLAQTRFDIVALAAHPCYDIAGSEAVMCADMYGITESLHSMLDTGKIIAHLRNRGVIAAAPVVPVQAETVVTKTEPEPNVIELTESEFQRMITERGKELWSVCREISGSLQEANHCYARNIRLLSRFDVSLAGNVH